MFLGYVRPKLDQTNTKSTRRCAHTAIETQMSYDLNVHSLTHTYTPYIFKMCPNKNEITKQFNSIFESFEAAYCCKRLQDFTRIFLLDRIYRIYVWESKNIELLPIFIHSLLVVVVSFFFFFFISVNLLYLPDYTILQTYKSNGNSDNNNLSQTVSVKT